MAKRKYAKSFRKMVFEEAIKPEKGGKESLVAEKLSEEADKKNAELKEELEILRKATAFLDKNQTHEISGDL